MLRFDLVDWCEIELLCRTECQMCSAAIHLTLNGALPMELLAAKGWHSVELESETFSAVCPQCIENLKQQQQAGEL